MISKSESLKRTRHTTECRRGPNPGEQFQVTRVTLQTPALGAWDVWEWSLLDRSGHVAHGSFPRGDQFVCADDVFDHLDYLFVRQHQLEYAGPDGPSDADPGL